MVSVQASIASQADHYLARRHVIAAHQNITFDGMFKIAQMMCGYVLESRDHPRLVTEPSLEGGHCRAFRRQLHAGDLRRDQRHRRIDYDLSMQAINSLLDSGALDAMWYC
ncbi:MAG: hypothetical protein A3G81_17685 [Betaproteobacteria bacterium RIFCSPLOWO2_12_FULL_65_14]|nr:MAG: hypothetical protein A3G81_17685 [Betaproteobacteria bacterium RIFCSPLOWO2_12_FULL_65_14]